HDHVGGAVDVDGVAILAAPAGAGGGVVDAVVGDDAAVGPFLAPPDPDSAVAGAADDVARDLHAAAVVAEQGVVGSGRDRVHRDGAVALHQRNAVAAGAQDAAIGDAQRAHVLQLDETMARRE